MKKLILLALLSIISNGLFAQVPAYIPTNGLLALYLFSGNPDDSSGYGNNGICVGDSSYGTDRFGNANSCFFADSMGAVEFPTNDFPGGNDGRTVSVFFKLDSPYADPGIIRELFAWGDNLANGNRFGLELVGDTSIGFEGLNTHVLCPFKMDTLWHNLTVTYPDSGTGILSISIYIDGEFVTPTSYIDTLTALTTDTTAGSESIYYAGTLIYSGLTFFTDPWYGYLDDIGVWNRSLTSCEIETMFYGPNPLVPVITNAGPVMSVPSTFTSYQWLTDDTAITGATNNTYTGNYNQYYQLVVTTPGGCTDTSVIFLDVWEGIKTISLADQIKVYPNPSNAVFNIQSPVPVNVVVSDLLGQTLIKKDNARMVDLSYMPSGTYLLSVFDTQGAMIKTERITYIGD